MNINFNFVIDNTPVLIFILGTIFTIIGYWYKNRRTKSKRLKQYKTYVSCWYHSRANHLPVKSIYDELKLVRASRKDEYSKFITDNNISDIQEFEQWLGKQK